MIHIKFGFDWPFGFREDVQTYHNDNYDGRWNMGNYKITLCKAHMS